MNDLDKVLKEIEEKYHTPVGTLLIRLCELVYSIKKLENKHIDRVLFPYLNRYPKAIELVRKFYDICDDSDNNK